MCRTAFRGRLAPCSRLRRLGPTLHQPTADISGARLPIDRPEVLDGLYVAFAEGLKEPPDQPALLGCMRRRIAAGYAISSNRSSGGELKRLSRRLCSPVGENSLHSSGTPLS